MTRLARLFIRIGFLPDRPTFRRFMRQALYRPFSVRENHGLYDLGPNITRNQARRFTEWLEKSPRMVSHERETRRNGR